METQREMHARLRQANNQLSWKLFGEKKDEMPSAKETHYFELLNGADLLRPGTQVADLGGGLSVFAPLLTGMGLKAMVVDDFAGGGGVERERRDDALKLLDKYRSVGVEIVEHDLLKPPLPLPDQSVDVVTCIHCLEHWHHSPKPVFEEIRRILKPRGHLLLVTPNAVNLRKRLAVICGRTNHAPLTSWYEEVVWRGHVREPVVRDLQQLLEWNDFELLATTGRNFIGRQSIALKSLPPVVSKTLGGLSEPILKFFPSLCSDIHVLGRLRK